MYGNMEFYEVSTHAVFLFLNSPVRNPVSRPGVPAQHAKGQ